MITTNDPALADHARSLGSLAYGRRQRFMHTGVGFNYRLTNLQAALGCAQLEKIESIIANKRRIAQAYASQLADVEELQLPVDRPGSRNVYWMYHVVLREPLRSCRDAIMEALLERGIETRPGFIPYNLQQVFIRQQMTSPELCPMANIAAEGGFYLPSSPHLLVEEIEYMCRHLKEVLRLAKRETLV